MPRKKKLPASEPVVAKQNTMEATVFSQEGKKAGSIALPERVFGARWNPDLVHQVVVAMQANARIPFAHTKNRGEVRGGGKKPWQQKGTGRARHGSIRSPLWRKGGVTFGPRSDTVFAKGLPKNMRIRALFSVLSRKFKDGEILFVDKLSFDAPKAAEAKKTMLTLAGIDGFGKIGTKKKNTLLVALPSRNDAVEKSFRNFGNVTVDETRNLNPVAVLGHSYLAIVAPSESIEVLAKRAAHNAANKN